MTALPHRITSRALGAIKAAAQSKDDTKLATAVRAALATYEAEMAAFKQEVTRKDAEAREKKALLLSKPE